MRKLLQLAAVNLILLGLLFGLVWLTQRPSGPSDPSLAMTPRPLAQTETPGESAQAEPVPFPSPLASSAPQVGSTEAPARDTPTVIAEINSVEPPPLDLISDPGDPAYNDAPTQTLSLPIWSREVANIRHAHLTFEFVFSNQGPGDVTSLDVYVSIPQSRANQRISNLSFSAPYTLTADRYDQEMAHFRFVDLAPGQDAKVSWEGDVEIEAMSYDLDPELVTGLDTIPLDIVATYTTDEEKYRLGSPVIQGAARTAAGSATNPYWIARNIHDFVGRRLSYQNDGRWDDVETVYQQRSGSCSEYAMLYVALCRANGLPARYVAGTRQRKEGTYEDTLFHRWAEVYLPPYGWVPVDPLHDDRAEGLRYDYFGGISDERFVTTVGGGDSEYLGWNYHYGYRYDYDQERPDVTRNRRFLWQPYSSELRASPAMLTGFALPDVAGVSLGQLGIATTNGAYEWSLKSTSGWLWLDREEGSSPDLVQVLADTTGLGLGTYRGDVVLESLPLGSVVAVPVELNVVDAIPDVSPEESGF